VKQGLDYTTASILILFVASKKRSFITERVNINTNTQAITRRHAHTLTK